MPLARLPMASGSKHVTSGLHLRKGEGGEVRGKRSKRKVE
jgi:hypothetical protein